MRYFIGGLIIKAKEYPQWKHFQYRQRKPWKVDFQTRLEADNLYEFIRDDLTEADVEKLERNRRIFG